MRGPNWTTPIKKAQLRELYKKNMTGQQQRDLPFAKMPLPFADPSLSYVAHAAHTAANTFSPLIISPGPGMMPWLTREQLRAETREESRRKSQEQERAVVEAHWALEHLRWELQMQEETDAPEMGLPVVDVRVWRVTAAETMGNDK